MRIFALTLLTVAALTAADPMADFNAAFNEQDFQAKRAAITAINSLPKDQDAAVYGALLRAAADRQGSELALAALASRSGTTVKPNDASGWGAWWGKEQSEREKATKLKDLDSKEKERAASAAKAAEGAQSPELFDGKPAAVAVAPVPERKPLPDDVGMLDRVRFKAGGSLVCYVRTVRRDEQNNIVSVRIIHPDGGEENLDGKIIAAIEEDIK